MKKTVTYLRYLFDYLKAGDIKSVVCSAKYLYNKTSHRNDRMIHTSIGTFFCRKNTNDFQFANYYYEWGVKKFILNQVKNYTVFIDGGACTGDYSILVSKFGLKCIAFEPVPSNFETIVKNLSLNKLSEKVRVFQLGLGNENTEVGFRFNPVNTGASHRYEGSNPDFRVPIRTFDSMLPELGIATQEHILFKLDVEGMEPETLQGAAEFIKTYPNITFVLEDKHTGQHIFRTLLSKMAVFEFGSVDEFNIYAHKTGNLT